MDIYNTNLAFALTGTYYYYNLLHSSLTIRRGSALDKQGYRILNKISPKFSIIFLVIIYLTIGPLFAIPRTASTSFEMTVTPIAHTNSSLHYLSLRFYFLDSLIFMY